MYFARSRFISIFYSHALQMAYLWFGGYYNLVFFVFFFDSAKPKRENHTQLNNEIKICQRKNYWMCSTVVYGRQYLYDNEKCLSSRVWHEFEYGCLLLMCLKSFSMCALNPPLANFSILSLQDRWRHRHTNVSRRFFQIQIIN